ncbi:glucan biosynthesis protein [Xinfangfangia pollutisoli]|uniref:glucan biosynthesis protein n=1 Tax=Xinfangfangia pollutisoli TaxID=2865960 RepID=UPI001CD567B3|nr:glucan biosynthesis protein D [Xinfangfangia pollutisoli]
MPPLPLPSVLRGLAASLVTLCLAAGPMAAETPPAAPAPATPALQIAYGPSQAFSFDGLKQRARDLAAKPYVPAVQQDAAALDAIDYDAQWKIRFRDDHSLLAGPEAPVQFFHLTRYSRDPVRISMVQGGQSREVLYTPDFFDMPADSPARKIEAKAAFAGFRIMRPDMQSDWISFLGASYYRTDGAEKQYGLSARGLALNTGLATPEEFPRFTEFFIAPGENGSTAVIYALLDSPSVTGAYRFDATNGGGQTITVSATLFFRNAVDRLGIAPMTSMYWYSETNRNMAFDWRPEVHDSDGLAIATGTGEQIWRPLSNPDRVVTSSFLDTNPRGFGLMQRDRDFDHYLDDGVFYNKRASVWIEPLGDWGPGQVQLVEIPTDDEIYDNIVAYWLPGTLPKAGDRMDFAYRQSWGSGRPDAGPLAQTVATRLGRGGVPGQPRPQDAIKLQIDFSGAALEGLSADGSVLPVISVGDGVEVIQAAARPVIGTDDWRLSFDLKLTKPVDTVDVRAYLDRDGAPLTETWLGQIHPRQFGLSAQPVAPGN